MVNKLDKYAKIQATAIMIVYNEQERIKGSLASIEQYFNEVVVFNKSSTDNTKKIVKENYPNVKLVDIPYTEKGDDNFQLLEPHVNNEWVFCITASEVVPFELINQIRKYFVSEKIELYDVVMVPRKYNVLGSYVPNSPWSIVYFPFLINLKKVKPQNKLHNHVTLNKGTRISYIKAEHNNCISHITNVTIDSFLISSINYAKLYAKQSEEKNFKNDLIGALRQNYIYQDALLTGNSLKSLKHLAAWNIYWSLNILYLIEKGEMIYNLNDRFYFSSIFLKIISRLTYFYRKILIFLKLNGL